MWDLFLCFSRKLIQNLKGDADKCPPTGKSGQTWLRGNLIVVTQETCYKDIMLHWNQIQRQTIHCIKHVKWKIILKDNTQVQEGRECKNQLSNAFIEKICCQRRCGGKLQSADMYFKEVEHVSSVSDRCADKRLNIFLSSVSMTWRWELKEFNVACTFLELPAVKVRGLYMSRLRTFAGLFLARLRCLN